MSEISAVPPEDPDDDTSQDGGNTQERSLPPAYIPPEIQQAAEEDLARELIDKRGRLKRRLLHAAEALNEKALTAAREGEAVDDKAASAALRWMTASAIAVDKFRLEMGERPGETDPRKGPPKPASLTEARLAKLRRDAQRKLP